MPKNHCNLCGHDWEGPAAMLCPKCAGPEWWEGEACRLDGGICDQCGCQFTTGLGKAHFCPNCGSKRWDHKATDNRRKLEDLHPWIMEKTKNGKVYHYWIASWREGDKVRNVHLGSCKKLDAEAAMQKARAIKAKALGIEP